ncbi:hypothetical protein WSM22_41260 [Cytophagales bacterium WSM2-2]|nr:hypothetical protein WSM22_41260 [Cytophagales bacterium WSM2-2]
MKTTLIAIICSIGIIRASATNYYLSEKGSDQQSGTSPSAPWRSLKRLSEVLPLLYSGDSILFERGSIFSGELKFVASGKAGHEIYIGAYGSGVKPVVLGSTKLNNWKLFRGNIWVAECIDCEEPGNLFADGRFQPLGRSPNDGYLTLSCSAQCKTALTDNQLASADGFWDGAEVVVKSSRWTLDNLPVSNYFNRTFYFATPASYALQNGYGYFVQKHLATLDRRGEWFFDKSSRKIFLYWSDGDTPGNHIIEASTTDIGLSAVNASFLIIENLTFKYQRVSGVQIERCKNVLLRDCDIQYSGDNGLEINSCQNLTVEHCRIEDANNNGVEWRNNSNGAFVGNFIQRTGLHPGRGRSGNGKYIGLSVTSDNPLFKKNLFQYNSIDSTGYIGIDFRTGGTLIKNNLVKNFCLIKDDGAGIYTWGNAYGDNSIEGNIVLHGVGSGGGTDNSEQVWVNGIYIDDRSSDIRIGNNTVAYCGTSGIFIHNARRIFIQGNTLFANGNHLTNRENGQLSIKSDGLVPDAEKNLDLKVTQNHFVTLQEGSHCIWLRAEEEPDLKTLGSFGQNLYGAPQAYQVVAKSYDRQDICNANEEFTLTGWQRCTGSDDGSQFRIVNAFADGTTGLNLVKNGRVINNTVGWIAWPSQVSVVLDKRNYGDGTSLKVLFPQGKTEALLYHAGFSLNRDKIYRLSFSAMSAAKIKIEFAPLMASAPWEALGDYACFSVDTVFKSFSYYFRPHRSSKEARVNFKSNATFWIDNVTLSEVLKEKVDDRIQLIYNVTDKPKTVSLQGKFCDLEGKQLSDTFTLPEYGSIILLKYQ